MDFLNENPISRAPMSPPRLNMSNPVSPARKPSHGFLQKIFSRQPSMPKLTTEGLENQVKYPQFDTDDNSSLVGLELVSCPYIHPLGNRLEPRIESAPLVHSISRKKGGGPRAARSCLSLDKAYEKPLRNLSVSDVMSIRSLTLREDIATAAAADASHLKEWDNYIKCYSEGRYSLTVPPGPPPKNSKFTYLPSTYPPNEIERLAAFQSSHAWSGSDIVWSNLEVECARSLIMAATTKFGTPWAAISFFDRDTEIVQAERGYSRHLIPRHESVASHVLLTDEVMTVLDTQKDWRFVGNPLVIGNPKIRFFAGAPMLSANSQVIGVFAIFAPEPRASFTAVQRHDLVGLSKIATRQLTARRHVSPDKDLQSNHLLQSDSCTGGTTNLYKPTSSITLKYHKSSQNGIPTSQFVINSEGRDALIHNGAYTPPNSNASDAGPSPILLELKDFGKNQEQLSLVSLLNQPPNDTRTPDSPALGDPASNFGSLQAGASSSSSDLDYMDPLPSPCRADFFYMHDTTESVARFRGKGVGFSFDDGVDLLTPHPNSLKELVSDTSSLSINSGGREALLEKALVLGKGLDPEFANETELAWTSPSETRDPFTSSINHEAANHHDSLEIESAIKSDLTFQRTHGSLDVQAEARFAAELWAKNLEFDVIYAVELIPKKTFNRKSELMIPGNVETRILVAYGLPDPINFDIPIHLDVLRGSGAIMWENNNLMPEEYSRGFMMSLLLKNRRFDYRSSGVVFGAFRKRAENFKAAEVERLQRAANVLKDILSKSPSLRRPSQGELESPSRASPRLYPANEAIEVGKISFDAGTSTRARKKKPKNTMR